MIYLNSEVYGLLPPFFSTKILYIVCFTATECFCSSFFMSLFYTLRAVYPEFNGAPPCRSEPKGPNVFGYARLMTFCFQKHTLHRFRRQQRKEMCSDGLDGVFVFSKPFFRVDSLPFEGWPSLTGSVDFVACWCLSNSRRPVVRNQNDVYLWLRRWDGYRLGGPEGI